MDKLIYKVYKIINTQNDKVYIGVTRRTIEKRFNNHIKTKPKYKLHHAIHKYGIDCFSVELLIDGLTRSEAMLKEQEFILLYDSYKNGYNSTEGGECPSTSRGRNYWTEQSKKSFLETRAKWFESEEGLQFKQRQRERFLILKPEQFITKEQRLSAKIKRREWVFNTEEGKKLRSSSAINMRKVQRLRHCGVYKFEDPSGKLHIVQSNILEFCKENNLSFHSFYYALTHNTNNNRGPNAGWKIIEWNVK